MFKWVILLVLKYNFIKVIVLLLEYNISVLFTPLSLSLTHTQTSHTHTSPHTHTDITHTSLLHTHIPEFGLGYEAFRPWIPMDRPRQRGVPVEDVTLPNTHTYTAQHNRVQRGAEQSGLKLTGRASVAIESSE